MSPFPSIVEFTAQTDRRTLNLLIQQNASRASAAEVRRSWFEYQDERLYVFYPPVAVP